MDSTGQKASDAQPQQSRKMCLACNQTFEGTMTHCQKDGTQLVSFGHDDNLGKIVSEKFKILELVGKGGMGAVYLAEDITKKNTWVAIKMLHAQLSEDKNSVKRFQQEASAASDLQHPNLILQHDFGMIDGKNPYLVMEFLQGESLSDRIKEHGPINPVHCCRLFSQVMDGLKYAHDKGVVHRDIKPSNILLLEKDGEEVVKVLDFGLAKLMPWSGKESQHLTKTGEVFGSPIYMSPEQCMGKQLEPSSDIYSLGITLYEALTGKPPFKGQNVVQTASKHLSDSPPPFEAIRPDLNLPINLQNVVFKALEKEPIHRFKTMQEFKEALVYAVTGQGSSSAQVLAPAYSADATQPVKRGDIDNIRNSTASSVSLRATEAAAEAKKPKMMMMAGGAVVALLLLGGGVFFMMNSNSEGPRQATGEIFYIETDVNPLVAEGEQITINELHINSEKGLIKLTAMPGKRENKATARGNRLVLGKVALVNYNGNDKSGHLTKFVKLIDKETAAQPAVNVVIYYFDQGSNGQSDEAFRSLSKSFIAKKYKGLSEEEAQKKFAQDLAKQEMRSYGGHEGGSELPVSSEFLSKSGGGEVPLRAIKVVSSESDKVEILVDGDRLFKNARGYLKFTLRPEENKEWKIDSIEDNVSPDEWREL